MYAAVISSAALVSSSKYGAGFQPLPLSLNQPGALPQATMGRAVGAQEHPSRMGKPANASTATRSTQRGHRNVVTATWATQRGQRNVSAQTCLPQRMRANVRAPTGSEGATPRSIVAWGNAPGRGGCVVRAEGPAHRIGAARKNGGRNTTTPAPPVWPNGTQQALRLGHTGGSLSRSAENLRNGIGASFDADLPLSLSVPFCGAAPLPTRRPPGWPAPLVERRKPHPLRR